MIEIRSYPEVLDNINSILSNGGTAEVSIETDGSARWIAVYETSEVTKCEF